MEYCASFALLFKGALSRIYWLLPALVLDPFDLLWRLFGVNYDPPSWLTWLLVGLGLTIAVTLTFHQERKKHGTKDDVKNALTRLSQHSVIYGENNTIGIDHVFAIIGDRLAQGLRAGGWSTGIFDQLIGKGWSSEAIEEVFKWLLLERLVTFQRIEPAMATSMGTYESIHALPYTIYYLTERGSLVYQWVSSVKQSKSRKARSPG